MSSFNTSQGVEFFTTRSVDRELPIENSAVVLLKMNTGERMAAVFGDGMLFFNTEILKILKMMKALGAQKKDIQIVILGSKTTLKSLRLKELFLSFGIEAIKVVFLDSESEIKLHFSPHDFQCRILEAPKKTALPLLELKPKIKVLIVDDSIVIQKILSSVLAADPAIEIIGIAGDAFQAEEMRKKYRPDVMTLDIHMPKKDGVTYLSEVLSDEAIPVIMISDLSRSEASPVMKALEIGAFDYLQKPSAHDFKDFGEVLIGMIKAAGGRKHHLARSVKRKKERNRQSSPLTNPMRFSHCSLVVIGSSTGGTEVIREIIPNFPEDMPPVLIVQHMPAVFTAKFADSLNAISKVHVKEAEANELIKKSTVYIAPGGQQMRLSIKKTGEAHIILSDDPPLNRFKPSVDYLFNSIADLKICKTTRAAILTGMGEDGARGMLKMKKSGAYTIAQSEDSCVVFGMPKAAIEFSATMEVLDIDGITEALLTGKGNVKKQA